ncbi:ABC transporter substrate-binding protein [Halorarum halobium]|uniref:ABC transporter substrate-binding protein n=1 Tax=Halorarum halobium TaxID=3075121 RepID=UPI0028AEA682|nr:ABC transporter substrate-binding protein [Halobaculum sp. XH14]
MVEHDTHVSENGHDGGMNRRRFLTTAGAGATLASTAGCIGNPLGGGGGVTFGGVYLLSGLAEALGSASEASAQLAVDYVNENGGINGEDAEIIFRDHADSGAASQIQSLVQQENVDALIGLTSSGETLEAAPTIRDLGVPMILTDIGTPYVTEPDTETYGSYFESENGKSAYVEPMFRTNANTSPNTYAMARYAVEELEGIETVANIGPNYAYGTQCWDYFKAYADALGGEFEYVESVFPDLGASNMTPQINQVLNADPDLVFTSFWAGDAVTFVQQASEQGLFEQVDDVFDTLGADPTVFKALGDTMPEGVHYSSWYWHSAFDNEQNSSYLDYYQSAYEGTDTIGVPSFTGASTWSAIRLYKRAIENSGGTEPDGIIGELEGATFNGPRGEWTLDADSHQATAPTVIGETSSDDDVPYEGVGLSPSRTYSLDRSTAADLLGDSGLPPGV